MNARREYRPLDDGQEYCPIRDEPFPEPKGWGWQGIAALIGVYCALITAVGTYFA